MNACAETSPPIRARGELLADEPMARHSSWRCGGPAAQYFAPADRTDLAQFFAAGGARHEVLWLGLGSNLLVRDGGVRRTVIATAAGLSALHWPEPDVLYAEAGVTCARLARAAAGAGRAGLEFMAGIPGTVGGALRMNAGALGGETWSYVSRVETIDAAGVIREYDRTAFRPHYRGVDGPEDWFLGAWLTLPQTTDTGAEQIRQVLAERNRSQPTGQATCGSVFRNPPGDFAGRLIEQCGLKGFSVGGAAVSGVHANFIVNDGSASAADIENLIRHVQRTVQQQHGVELELEVVIVGEPAASTEAGS